MEKRTWYSHLAHRAKLLLKAIGAFVLGRVFRKHCYPIFGIPIGLEKRVELKQGVKTEVYSSLRCSVKGPLTIEGRLHSRFQAILGGIEMPGGAVLVVPHGVGTNKGGNLSSEGKLIATFLQSFDGEPPHKNELFDLSAKRFFPKIYHTKHPVVTLATGWQRAFYHWVFEVLPRFHLIEKAGYSLDQIYIESETTFQKESLQLLGICDHQIIPAQTFSAVKTPQLVIPSIPFIPTTWACHYLRDKIVPQLTQRDPLRLYVSRADAIRRRVINEEEVFQLLKGYGFQKVELSRLSFKEQAELFLAAEVVVGPHGAGFSHLTFCKPQTSVLEFFSPAYLNGCYWHVCDRMGLPYHYLFGEGERFPDFEQPNLDPDMTIDLQKLQASLKLMRI